MKQLVPFDQARIFAAPMNAAGAADCFFTVVSH
jgi:hypothetical protein